MLNRSKRGPDVGFHICEALQNDAVDLYPHLKDLTEMKPVVVSTDLSFEQLFEEFARLEDAANRDAVREQILIKMRRRLKRLNDQARALYQAEAGETPEATLKRLTEEPPDIAAAWVKQKPEIGRILDWDPDGSAPMLIPISHHPDEVVAVSRGYGAGQKPEDFLDGRARPVPSAMSTNEDIAASIIGFVRQAAVGDALTPFDVRVKSAMRRILASRSWTDVQRKWLKRIEEQIMHELVVDRAAVDEEPFTKDGGFQRLNKVFGGQLEAVLGDINEELWKKAA